MEKRYKAIIIGGGIIGVSALYHLAKFGWTDCILLERAELTSGSTWHAAAGFHAINGDPNVARLQAYTVDLYREVEEISGQSCGLHMTGGLTVATSSARWEWLEAEWARQQVIGLHSRMVKPAEVKRLCPLMDVSDIRGGLFDPNEGHLDPNGATYAFAKAATKLGATVRVRTMVRGLEQLADGGWIAVTNRGNFEAEYVVNAAGLWAPRVGEMVGLKLPIVPMEHMYIVTEAMDSVAALAHELPMTADLDAHTYLRQEQRSVLIGVYEENPRHWHVNGVPWDFGMELIPENLERISEPLMKGFKRFPDLQKAGIRRVVNGGMVFSPDGNPIVGPVAGVQNYWLACGSMAGFSQNGAVGRSLAEWMVHGEPSIDVFAMDVARFGPHVGGRYLLEKTYENYARRFKLAYPNEQLPAGRPLKTPPLYPAQKAENAVFGASYGQEVPLYFAGPRTEPVEIPTFRRSNAFNIVGEECRVTREYAGLLDSSTFAKYRVVGPRAEEWIAKMLAGRIPAPGRIRLAPMLSPSGRLLGDLTLFRLEEQEFMIFGSGYLQTFHMRWFAAHAERGVTVENVTDTYAGLAISGPRAVEIVAGLMPEMDAMPPLFETRRVEVGRAPAIMGRLSITGEFGFEFYVEPQYLNGLYQMFREAGASFGMKPIGVYAVNALRLEKSYGIWSREFTNDYTPKMSGLDRFVDYQRKGFIGRDAALKDRDAMPARMLVTLVIDADDADASGFEPIWHDGRLVGFTTSGGYGHTIGESLALGYVDASAAREGEAVTVHIIGRARKARITLKPRFDELGLRMRTHQVVAARHVAQ